MLRAYKTKDSKKVRNGEALRRNIEVKMKSELYIGHDEALKMYWPLIEGEKQGNDLISWATFSLVHIAGLDDGTHG